MTTFAPASSASQAAHVHPLSPAEARSRVEQGSAVLIDVREPFERAASSSPGATRSRCHVSTREPSGLNTRTKR